MAVKLKLNLAFQELAGTRDLILLNGQTVQQCLDDFVARYPRTRSWLYDDSGKLQSLVLLNGESVPQDQLDHPVTPQDELWILNILEGG